MADKDDIREGKDFGLDVPQQNRAFHVKGSGALDWGMQNRLARIFNPASGRTVMLAFDHGYFQGPTTGLERIDLTIVPLIPHADVLMCTRGALRSVIPAGSTNALVLRCSGGQSILTEPAALHTAVLRLPGTDGTKMSKSYGNAILMRDLDRLTDPAKRPEGSRLCEFVAWGVPVSFGEASS